MGRAVTEASEPRSAPPLTQAYNLPMDFASLEKQALSLPAADRARLAQELLGSLDSLSPDEHRALWLDEAQRCAAQIDRGEVRVVPADEVARKARALLK